MTTLLIAEHEHSTLKDSTNKALTAAAALGGERPDDVYSLSNGRDAQAG